MFKELLSNPMKMEPGQLQRQARMHFPSIISLSHLQERKPDDPIPQFIGSKFAIIGIATYAQEELGLLDRLENAHSLWKNQWEVAVFDVTGWKNPADAHGFVTQMPVVTQTPVLEIWIDGKVVDTKAGLRMVQESLQKFGLLS